MASYLIFLCLFISIFGVVKSQSSRSEKDPYLCSQLVRSCQAKCSSPSQRFVRWTVNVKERDFQCHLHDFPTALPTSAVQPFKVVYDVQCCPQNSVNVRNAHFSDDGKVNILIILGVGTLLSIFLMCVFSLASLILFYRRRRNYKRKTKMVFLKRKERANKEPKTSSTNSDTATVKEFSPEHKGKIPKTTSNFQNGHVPKAESHRRVRKAAAETRPISPNLSPVNLKENGTRALANRSLSIDEEEKLDYVNQTPTPKPPKKKVSDNRTASDITCEKMAGRTEVAQDYEIHGGFTRPRQALNSDESNYMRYSGLFLESRNRGNGINPSTATFQVSDATNKSGDAVEDPYVLAPPLKSNRCKPKSDAALAAYQRLMPNGSGLTGDPDEYNMLLHNSSVLSQDAKAVLIFKNNINGTSTAQKCHVILRPHELTND